MLPLQNLARKELINDGPSDAYMCVSRWVMLPWLRFNSSLDTGRSRYKTAQYTTI